MRIASPTRSWLFSAFAAAELISLWMSSAAPRGENCSSARACSMCMPRTWSAIRRALLGETRTYLALALTTGSSSGLRERRRDGAGFFSSALAAFLARRRFFPDSGFSPSFLSALAGFSLSAFGSFFAAFFGSFLAGLSPESFFAAAFLAAGFFAGFSALASAAFDSFGAVFSLLSFSSAISQSVCLVAAAVRAEGAGRRELAELVADHRLRDEDRHVFFAVVDGDRVADHLREDRRGPRPGFDHLFFAGLVLRVDPRHQPLFDPRALFRRTPHGLPPTLLLAATSAADDVTVGLLALLAGAVAERRLAPRGDRVATGRVVSLAAAVRVVDRVHR